jgi:phospholipid/cholesterol/gamma-HCH transport system ATP-binding protein
MEAPLVRLEHVGLRFGGHEVLRDLTFNVERGQTVAIIGESGCGKTVLLKLIIGLLRASSGRVLFDGRSLLDLDERELTRQRLRFGFVFQLAALFDSLSVYDNVAFPLREHTRRSETEIAVEVRQRLQEVGMPQGAENRKPAELSGGMRKRVGLARAIILNPEIILYDEPTTGLDPVMSDVINELIRQTHQRRGVTSVVVTHDMKTVLKVANRVLMIHPLSRLKPGEPQIIFDGDLKALHECQDECVARFVRGEAASVASQET